MEIDLLPYVGQPVTLTFRGHNGQFYPTAWFVDHVEINFCPAVEREFRLFLPLSLKAGEWG